MCCMTNLQHGHSEYDPLWILHGVRQRSCSRLARRRGDDVFRAVTFPIDELTWDGRRRGGHRCTVIVRDVLTRRPDCEELVSRMRMPRADVNCRPASGPSLPESP